MDDLEVGGEMMMTTEDESSHPGSASEGEHDAGAKGGMKGKKGRPKRVMREDTPGMSSVSTLSVQHADPLKIPAPCHVRDLNVNTFSTLYWRLLSEPFALGLSIPRTAPSFWHTMTVSGQDLIPISRSSLTFFATWVCSEVKDTLWLKW